jgi:hypothetical protein
MAEEVVVVSKAHPVRRRLIEGAIGVLAGVVLACMNGPWLLSLLYTPPSGDALSCGPTVNNALAYFVKLELGFGIFFGALVLAGSFVIRRLLKKRREAGALASP